MTDRTRQGYPFRSILIPWSFCPVNPVLWALHRDISLSPFSPMGCTAPLTTSAFHVSPQARKISKLSEKKTPNQSTQRKTFCAFCRISAAVAHNGQLWASSSYICCRINSIFLTHALGMKGLSCCPHFTDPFPSHLSVHQESFSPDPSTIRAESDGFITVILFCADNKLFN